MSVAGILAVAFAVVAATNRTARGAWWLALGYGMGIVYVALEFLLTRQVDPTPVGIGIFLVFLLAVSFALVGVAGHYGARPPLAAMAVIWVLTILAVPAIFSMTYGSTLRLMLYQLRSEEHTSELQSLMRISYAVFCLKKKTTIQKT